MRLATLWICMLCFITFFDLDAQAGFVPGPGQSIYSTTGTIIKVRRNRIIVNEDGSHKQIKFYYMRRDIDRYRAGERIRVYYRDIRRPVISIKKLTKLEFAPTGQNLGYISGNPSQKGE